MLCIDCDVCFVFTVSPPPFVVSGRLRCYRLLHPCRLRPRRRRQYRYSRASRQAAIPLSHISPICLYLSVALGICCCYDSVLFQLHSLSLSPLDYFPISYAAWYNNIFSSGPCPLLV